MFNGLSLTAEAAYQKHLEGLFKEYKSAKKELLIGIQMRSFRSDDIIVNAIGKLEKRLYRIWRYAESRLPVVLKIKRAQLLAEAKALAALRFRHESIEEKVSGHKMGKHEVQLENHVAEYKVDAATFFKAKTEIDNTLDMVEGYLTSRIKSEQHQKAIKELASTMNPAEERLMALLSPPAHTRIVRPDGQKVESLGVLSEQEQKLMALLAKKSEKSSHARSAHKDSQLLAASVNVAPSDTFFPPNAPITVVATVVSQQIAAGASTVASSGGASQEAIPPPATTTVTHRIPTVSINPADISDKASLNSPPVILR
jgi:hypothetical protein